MNNNIHNKNYKIKFYLIKFNKIYTKIHKN